MNKAIKLLTLAAVAATILTGCNKDQESYTTFSVRTYSYVTAHGERPVISTSEYSFDCNYSTGSSVVAAKGFNTSDGVASFTTGGVPFDSYSMSTEFGPASLFTGKIAKAGKTTDGEEITDFSYTCGPLYLPPRDYWNLQYTVAEGSGLPHPDLGFAATRTTGLCLNAVIGGTTRLRTFQSDLTFIGKTTTTVGGNPESAYENSGIRYRVKMNIETGKADVIMYDVKFNSSMPDFKQLILSGLDLVFDEQGYRISGHDLTPLYINGGVLVEQPMFPISDFTLVSGDDLVGATIIFTVAPRIPQMAGVTFNGSFAGDCMVKVN